MSVFGDQCRDSEGKCMLCRKPSPDHMEGCPGFILDHLVVRVECEEPRAQGTGPSGPHAVMGLVSSLPNHILQETSPWDMSLEVSLVFRIESLSTYGQVGAVCRAIQAAAIGDYLETAVDHTRKTEEIVEDTRAKVEADRVQKQKDREALCAVLARQQSELAVVKSRPAWLKGDATTIQAGLEAEVALTTSQVKALDDALANHRQTLGVALTTARLEREADLRVELGIDPAPPKPEGAPEAPPTGSTTRKPRRSRV